MNNYQIKNKIIKKINPLIFGLIILSFIIHPSFVLAIESTFTTSLTTTGLIIGSPSVPANLSANPTSSTQIDLSWSASTANYYSIAGYRIFRDSVFWLQLLL